MRVVHIDFTGTYNEETAYQENIIPKIHKQMGHEVTFVTTCYIWDEGKETHVPQEDKRMECGVRLIRLAYKKIPGIGRYLRSVNGLAQVLEEIKPNVIMLHCLQTMATYDVIRYCQKYPDVVFVADSHTDANNSATNLFSKILHQVVYRKIVIDAVKHIDKMFFITPECRDFFHNIYGINTAQMEILPLGGFPYEDESFHLARQLGREACGYNNGEIVFAHSGKMDASKRSLELARAFSSIKNERIRLLLIGVFSEEIRHGMEEIVQKDKRILHVGWQDSQVLQRLLCAADVYVQPGSQSATLQMAICCRCAIVARAYKSHTWLLGDQCIYVEAEAEVKEALENLAADETRIASLSAQATAIGKNLLDYHVISERVLFVKEESL